MYKATCKVTDDFPLYAFTGTSLLYGFLAVVSRPPPVAGFSLCDL
jgi:hypothetical protein